MYVCVCVCVCTWNFVSKSQQLVATLVFKHERLSPTILQNSRGHAATVPAVPTKLRTAVEAPKDS